MGIPKNVLPATEFTPAVIDCTMDKSAACAGKPMMAPNFACKDKRAGHHAFSNLRLNRVFLRVLDLCLKACSGCVAGEITTKPSKIVWWPTLTPPRNPLTFFFFGRMLLPTATASRVLLWGGAGGGSRCGPKFGAFSWSDMGPSLPWRPPRTPPHRPHTPPAPPPRPHHRPSLPSPHHSASCCQAVACQGPHAQNPSCGASGQPVGVVRLGGCHRNVGWDELAQL